MLNLMANLSSSFFSIRHFFLLIVCIITLTLGVGQRSFSHEISPAIAELSIKENIVEIDFYFSVEIFLADIDASIITDTNETNKSEVYDELRSRDSDEIEMVEKNVVNTTKQVNNLQSNVDKVLVEIQTDEKKDLAKEKKMNETLEKLTNRLNYKSTNYKSKTYFIPYFTPRARTISLSPISLFCCSSKH